MRICFISNPNAPHTRRWVNWFVHAGHTICVIADHPVEYPWPGIEIFDLSKVFSKTLLRWPIWSIWLRGFIRRWRPDILHAHRVSAAGWLAWATGFHPNVITPWGSDLYLQPQRSRLARWLARQVLSNADLITADAQDLLRLAQFYGATETHCALIEWGVDSNLFKPRLPDPALKHKLGLGSGPVILSLRAVKPIYNLDVIVKAFDIVRVQISDAQLLLRDYDAEGSYRNMINALIYDLNLQSSVFWLERLEPWERIAPVYNLAQLAVSVPSSDSVPVSVLEAMASGVPVIASDLPALREWITDGVNGSLVKPGDTNSLANAMMYNLQNPALIAPMIKQNLDLVSKHANHDSEMKKVEKLYQSLVRSGAESHL